MTSRTKTKFIFPVITIAISFFLIEITLHVVSFAMPKKYYGMLGISKEPIFVKDSRLGLRPNPNFTEHDDRGFRNESTNGPIFMLALGDSQTYGTDVKREEAWPQQLAQLNNQNTYNMACGGWGPTQSLMIFDEAISLRPKVIVEAFYSGNDLYDSFSSVYYDGQLSELKTADKNDANRVLEAEQKESLHDKVMALYNHGGGISVNVLTQYEHELPTSPSQRIRKFLGDHVRLYQLVAVLKRNLTASRAVADWEAEKQSAKSSSDKDYYVVFESGQLKTIFTPKLRLSALDLDDPRIAEGHHVALEAIKAMNQKANAVGILFAVVFIPTKELVFKDLASSTVSSASTSYRSLLENEQLFRERTMAYLQKEKIKTIDALPALAARVRNGLQPYPATPNGHPNGLGHRAIAEVVLKELNNLNQYWTNRSELERERNRLSGAKLFSQNKR